MASEAAADAACDAEASRPFSLSAGPPIRALLVRRDSDDGAQRASFVLTAHHIVGDGASFRVIEAELKALYEAAVRGALDGALRPLKYDYVDYAHWQREAAGVLARSAGRRSVANRAAVRRAASVDGVVCRVERGGARAERAGERGARRGTRARRHDVHDTAGGVAGGAARVQPARQCVGGRPDCGPWPQRV